MTAFPQFGAYRAATWAVEGLPQSLRHEVAGFGIHVTCVDPGPHATGFAARGLRRSDTLPASAPLRNSTDRRSWQLGDDRRTASGRIVPCPTC